MKKTNLFLLLILTLSHSAIKPSNTKQGIFTEKFYIATKQENDKNYLEVHNRDAYLINLLVRTNKLDHPSLKKLLTSTQIENLRQKPIQSQSLILKKELVGIKKAVALRKLEQAFDKNTLYVDEEGSDYLIFPIEEKSNNVLHNVIFNKLTKKNKKRYNLTETYALIEKNFSIKALKDGHVRIYNNNNTLIDEKLISTNSPICSLRADVSTNSNQTILYYSTLNSAVGSINISNNDLCIDSSNDILDSQDNNIHYAKFDNKKDVPNLIIISSTPNENQELIQVIDLTTQNTIQGIINKNQNLKKRLKNGFIVSACDEKEINLTYDNKKTTTIPFCEYINNSPTTLFVDNLIIRVSNKNEIDLYKNKKYKETWETGLKVPIVNLLLCKNFDHEGNEKKDTILFETLNGSVGKIIIADSKTKPYFTRLVHPIN